MPTPTLVATAGSASANSYCTLAEANDYHDARLFSTDWTGASTDNQTIALIMATRLLDAMYEWAGWCPTTTQALAWPRSGVPNAHGTGDVDSTTIPTELKYATAEFARQLIVADRSLDSDIETQGLQSLSAGPVSLAFRDGVRAKVVPDAVVNLLPSWWGRMRSTLGTRPLARA